MDFTLQFAANFARGVFYAAPLLLSLVALIAATGLLVGRREGWTRADALYYAFITATTVGYGDFHPSHRFGKLAAIAIALTGLLLTGILVAIGVHAATVAFGSMHPRIGAA